MLPFSFTIRDADNIYLDDLPSIVSPSSARHLIKLRESAIRTRLLHQLRHQSIPDFRVAREIEHQLKGATPKIRAIVIGVYRGELFIVESIPSGHTIGRPIQWQPIPETIFQNTGQNTDRVSTAHQQPDASGRPFRKQYSDKEKAILMEAGYSKTEIQNGGRFELKKLGLDFRAENAFRRLINRAKWRPRYVASALATEDEPETTPYTPPATSEQELHYVEFQYVKTKKEEDDKGVDNLPYRLTLPNGRVKEGVTDRNGRARVDGLTKTGTATIEYGNPEDEAEIKQIRSELQATLDGMVEEVRERAKQQEAELEKAGLLKQGYIYTGAFLNGLYEAGEGAVVGIYDMVVWTGEQYISWQQYKTRTISNIVTGDYDLVKKEFEQAVGDAEQQLDELQEAMDNLEILMSDEGTREILADFPLEYFDAHSSVEQTEMAGGLSFEILLALVTVGVGTAASILSKSRYFTKAQALIQRLTKVLKRRRFNRTKQGPTDKINTHKKDDWRQEKVKVIPRNRNGGFIDPDAVDKINDPARKPKLTDDGKVITSDGSEKTIINKGNLDENGYLHKKGKSLKYDDNGFPEFESKYDTVIDDKHLGTGKPDEHFKAANNSLAKQLKENPKLADEMGLSKEQVEHITKSPSPVEPPDGYTWHHHQDIGRMQLVNQNTHKTFRHTGGMSIWGGGYN